MPGYEQEGAQRAGHIPGAASVPWAQAVREDGTFKSADELAALYAARACSTATPIIAYCRIGERSAHTWFVLHELLGQRRRQELRRLLDGVGQPRRRPDREERHEHPVGLARPARVSRAGARRRRRRPPPAARGDARPRGLGGRPVQHQRHHERRHALRLRRRGARGPQGGRGAAGAHRPRRGRAGPVPGADGQRAGAAAHAAVQRRALARGARRSSRPATCCSSTRSGAKPVACIDVGRCRRTRPSRARRVVRDRRQPERQAPPAHRDRLRDEHVPARAGGDAGPRRAARRRAARRGRTRRCGPTTRRSARSSTRRAGWRS